jgi:hypothetical protein
MLCRSVFLVSIAGRYWTGIPGIIQYRRILPPDPQVFAGLGIPGEPGDWKPATSQVANECFFGEVRDWILILNCDCTEARDSSDPCTGGWRFDASNHLSI